MDAVIPVLAALTGAVVGSIGAVVVKNHLDRKAESARLEEALVQRYLLALQEAVESLWFRLHNTAEMGGRGVATRSDPTYWEATGVFALGRALGAERLLSLDGVVGQIARTWPELGEALREHHVATRVKKAFGDDLFHYDIVLLAETVLVQSDGGPTARLMQYGEFRRAFRDPDSGLRESVKRPIDALDKMDKQQNESIRAAVSALSKELSEATGVPQPVLIRESNSA